MCALRSIIEHHCVATTDILRKCVLKKLGGRARRTKTRLGTYGSLKGLLLLLYERRIELLRYCGHAPYSIRQIVSYNKRAARVHCHANRSTGGLAVLRHKALQEVDWPTSGPTVANGMNTTL